MGNLVIEVGQQIPHSESPFAIKGNGQELIIQIDGPMTTVSFGLDYFRCDVCHSLAPYVPASRRKRNGTPNCFCLTLSRNHTTAQSGGCDW